MTDVSVPPTPFDDELVTRKILREELSKHPTHADLAANHPTHEDLARALANHPTHEDLARALANHPTHEQFEAELSRLLRSMEESFSRQIRAMEENLITQMTALLEPSSDHGPRLAQLEARTTVLAHRVDALEAPRKVRRKPARKRTSRK